MSNFNLLYKTICEDEIFKASTPEEGIRRKAEYAKIKVMELLDQRFATKNPDGSYDVKGALDLNGMGLSKLPVRFNKVERSFDVSSNVLTTLEGCPKQVGGYFCCDSNFLTSLVGGPETVGGFFTCSRNKLTSLDGCPEMVIGNFYCMDQMKIQFTEREVAERCEVKGEIFVKLEV